MRKNACYMKLFENGLVKAPARAHTLHAASIHESSIRRKQLILRIIRRILTTLLPVLSLRRITQLRRHAEQTVAEFLGRMLEIARQGLHHAATVHEAQRTYEAAHFALGIHGHCVAHVQEAGRGAVQAGFVAVVAHGGRIARITAASAHTASRVFIVHFCSKMCCFVRI